MGYHIDNIPKGVLGQSSKIYEELMELQDAEKQHAKILIMCELADLYGALEAYAERVGLDMNDLKSMSDMTKEAFCDGTRH